MTLGLFFGVQKMTTLPVEQLTQSGFALLQDLTIPDPTYILPAALLALVNVQISVRRLSPTSCLSCLLPTGWRQGHGPLRATRAGPHHERPARALRRWLLRDVEFYHSTSPPSLCAYRADRLPGPHAVVADDVGVHARADHRSAAPPRTEAAEHQHHGEGGAASPAEHEGEPARAPRLLPPAASTEVPPPEQGHSTAAATQVGGLFGMNMIYQGAIDARRPGIPASFAGVVGNCVHIYARCWRGRTCGWAERYTLDLLTCSKVLITFKMCKHPYSHAYILILL